ncbi:MAG TPA: alpha-amylase family glycosyl hydrolase [Opitutaceae bacterium]|nr:alpha-amylase family glycosyl hydrolase [Opitutaceae bacterium]
MKSRYSIVRLFTILLGALASLAGAEPLQVCGHLPALAAPEWIRKETIYEVNVRQFSAAGTFAGVEADLPRLKDLGVGVLWFMPIYPIGVENRKGTLGSPYAVRDYYGVNPEFGTEADFAKLVNAAHAQGFRVVLDWVPNHTAWDNPLVKEHPDFYVRDAQGRCVPPTDTDWTDVVQLDFKNPAVREYETAAMTHWIQKFGVDGFRCDFAKGLPTAFWDEVSARLRAVKPDLFLLAEADLPQEQLRAFQASYSFGLMKVFNDVAAGGAGVSKIEDEVIRTQVVFPQGAILLRYTTNHDENSWAGTDLERLGGGVQAFAVMTFMLDGIPLLYNGQEAGLDHRLKFFEHDPIPWRPSPMADFYRTLCALKRTDPALRTGEPMRRIATTVNGSIYAVLREAGAHRAISFCNLTAKDATVDAVDPALNGRWRDVFTGEIVTWQVPVSFALQSWKYRVLVSVE